MMTHSVGERPNWQYRKILPVLLLAGTFLLVAIPGWQLVHDGPFHWHIDQPEFWQGGIEALVLMALLSGAQLLDRSLVRFWLTALVAELYMRRHGVDVPVFIDVVYVETAIGLGALLMRLTGIQRPDSAFGYARRFVLGLCLWSAFAWILSAIGFGTLHDLRWLTLLLMPFALFARTRPWTAFVQLRINGMPSNARVFAAVMLGWLLVLFARSNVAFDYDALWYGLRGNYVLVGDGSAFASMGLTAPVHYFPKLYELFLVPLSGLGSSSVVSGISVLLLSLLAAVLWDLLRRLGVYNNALRFLGILACLTLPAIANIAMGPKPDTLAAFFLVMGWACAARAIRSRRGADLLWLFSLLLLATQAKLTAVPFAGALVLAVGMRWFRREHFPGDEIAASAEWHLAIAATLLAVLVTLMITARTLILAGVPTIGPDPLFKLWEWLGFQLKSPAGTIAWSYPTDWGGMPQLAVDLLFRPQLLDHIVITWVGNIWLWLAMVVLLAGQRWSSSSKAGSCVRSITACGIALIAVGALLMFFWGYQVRGGDGNYFIAALVPAIVLSFAASHRSIKHDNIMGKTFVLCVGVFCLFDAAYSFASGAWKPGTLAWDMNFGRGLHSFRHYDRNVLEANGIDRIVRELRARKGTARVVGYLNEPACFALPASCEDLWMVSFTHPEYVNDRMRFLRFLADNRIDFLIMPHADIDRTITHITPTMQRIGDEIAREPGVAITKDRNYDLYDLSDLPGHSGKQHQPRRNPHG